MLRTLAVAVLLIAPSLTAPDAGPYVPTDAERARWTTFDMNSWAIVLDAYYKDTNRFPDAATFEELINKVQPVYIRVAPARDAWGRAYSYGVTADGSSCTLASAGSDGQFESDPSGEAARLSDFADDAIIKDGKLVRGWEFR